MCIRDRDRPIPLGDHGGRLRIELNHISETVLPLSFRLRDNDSRILAVARNLADEGHDVCVISKDLPMRVKASALGLDAEEYRAEWIGDDEHEWSGMVELDVDDELVSRLYADEDVRVPGSEGLPSGAGLILHSHRGSALARLRPDGGTRVVRGDLSLIHI